MKYYKTFLYSKVRFISKIDDAEIDFDFAIKKEIPEQFACSGIKFLF